LFQKFFEKDSGDYHAILLEYGAFSKSAQSKRTNPLSWVLNSDLFKSTLRSAFEEMASILLEEGDRFPSSFLRSFVSVVQKAERFNRSLLLVFLMDQSYVQGILRKKLERTHLFFRRDPPVSEELNAYLAALKSSLLETPPVCKTDVEKVVKSVVRASAISLLKEGEEQDLFIKTYNRETGEEPPSKVLGDFNEFMENRSRLFEVYINYTKRSYDFKFEEIVSGFKAVFGREITVYELRSLQRRVLEGEEISAVLARYKSNYRQMYDIFEDVFQEFLTRAPELFEFVREFSEEILQKVSFETEAVQFKEHVIDLILNGPEYMEVTTKFVRQFFESIINRGEVPLTSEDVRYFAHRLREGRLSVRDHSSLECMHQMLSEWTAQKEEIEELFETILGRACEPDESAKFVEYYRWDDRKGVRTKIVIGEELYMSLEYQDVIKTKITRLVPKIPRASLYSIMAKGIESDEIKTLRSDEEILAFTKRCTTSSDA
jgi:hypothetical protein